MIVPGHWILNDAGEPVRARHFLEWAQWLRDHHERTRIRVEEIGGCCVSTVFLGLEQVGSEPGRPVIFETMVFDPEGHDIWSARTCTRAEALRAHAEGCAIARRRMMRAV